MAAQSEPLVIPAVEVKVGDVIEYAGPDGIAQALVVGVTHGQYAAEPVDAAQRVLGAEPVLVAPYAVVRVVPKPQPKGLTSVERKALRRRLQRSGFVTVKVAGDRQAADRGEYMELWAHPEFPDNQIMIKWGQRG